MHRCFNLGIDVNFFRLLDKYPALLNLFWFTPTFLTCSIVAKALGCDGGLKKPPIDALCQSPLWIMLCTITMVVG
uniref:Uncharacterized protein n=1 Tax=Solanum tuberosum TaxID=4113 RepID=M1CMB8_SOLTU